MSKTDIAKARKALVALGAAVAALLSAGLIPAEYAAWGTALITFLGAIGVYVTPNAQTAPAVQPDAPIEASVTETRKPSELPDLTVDEDGEAK